jgi:hypothetical protein
MASSLFIQQYAQMQHKHAQQLQELQQRHSQQVLNLLHTFGLAGGGGAAIASPSSAGASGVGLFTTTGQGSFSSSAPTSASSKAAVAAMTSAGALASVQIGAPVSPAILDRQQRLVNVMKVMYPSAGILYVMTHDFWLAHNAFKVGKTGDWPKRLAGYNSHHPTDVWPVMTFVCNDVHLAEELIKLRLGAYLYPKRHEFVSMDLGHLRSLIESVLEVDQRFSSISLAGGGGGEPMALAASLFNKQHKGVGSARDVRGFDAFRVRTTISRDDEIDRALAGIKSGLCSSVSFQTSVKRLKKSTTAISPSTQAILDHIKTLVPGDEVEGSSEFKKAGSAQDKESSRVAGRGPLFQKKTAVMSSAHSDGRPITMNFLSAPDIDLAVSLKSRFLSFDDPPAKTAAKDTIRVPKADVRQQQVDMDLSSEDASGSGLSLGTAKLCFDSSSKSSGLGASSAPFDLEE